MVFLGREKEDVHIGMERGQQLGGKGQGIVAEVKMGEKARAQTSNVRRRMEAPPQTLLGNTQKY